MAIDSIKELRDRTGVSIMQCKKALEEAGGDMEKAVLILRKKAGAAAAKKADRELSSGVVAAYVHNNTVGAMVVLQCETDFVANNEEFVQLARDIAMQITATSPKFAGREDVPPEEMQKLREVFDKEAGDKPGEVKEKIIEGKLGAYFKEVMLLEQPYIKDPDRTIKDLIEEGVQKFGERIVLSDFARYSVR